MKYRAFLLANPDVQVAEISADFPLLKRGEQLPVSVDGVEALYIVKTVGDAQYIGDSLVIDIQIAK